VSLKSLSFKVRIKLSKHIDSSKDDAVIAQIRMQRRYL